MCTHAKHGAPVQIVNCLALTPTSSLTRPAGSLTQGVYASMVHEPLSECLWLSANQGAMQRERERCGKRRVGASVRTRGREGATATKETVQELEEEEEARELRKATP